MEIMMWVQLPFSEDIFSCGIFAVTQGLRSAQGEWWEGLFT